MAGKFFPATALVHMEKINSRKNSYIVHLRRLGADGEYRRECGELVCDGEKLLREAISSGLQVTSVLYALDKELVAGVPGYVAPRELMEYASPLKNSPGPVFTVTLPEIPAPKSADRVIVLESVQDPGNVGTVIRAADALGLDAVILVGDCADRYSPRTVRATMGAAFRQPVIETDTERLPALLSRYGLPLFGAALHRDSVDIRHLPLSRSAVAVGNEGSGLSDKLLSICNRSVIIPISPCSESLNAAMAATIIMWEMIRK